MRVTPAAGLGCRADPPGGRSRWLQWPTAQPGLADSGKTLMQHILARRNPDHRPQGWAAPIKAFFGAARPARGVGVIRLGLVHMLAAGRSLGRS